MASRAQRKLRALTRGFGRIAIALIGAALAQPALPRSGLWLAIFASVALIHFAIRGLGFWAASGIGVLAGFVFYYGQSAWMTTYLGPVPLVALAGLEGMLFGLGLGLAAATWRWLSRRRKTLGIRYQMLATTWLPLIWVAREWLACHFPYGGYQWSQLGQSVADTSLAGLAFWGGIPLVSFGVAALSIGVVIWLEGKPWRLQPAGQYWVRTVAALSMALVTLALMVVTPAVQASVLDSHAKPLKVVAIQGNAKAGLFANQTQGSILLKHLQETRRYFTASKPGGASGERGAVDLMVWPENSSDLSPVDYAWVGDEIRSIANRLNAPILVGSVVQEGNDFYNEGLLYRPGVETPEVYRKLRPVPFGEYVPDREFFHSLAPQLVDMIYRGYTPGTRVGTFRVGGTTIGDLICFEIGIDEITHNLVKQGSTVIVSQANNADFGRTDEAFQQEALVRLQAISAGRPIVHASTVATTEIVSATGERLVTTEPFTPAFAQASVIPQTALTPAMALFGWINWTAGSAAFVAILILISKFVRGLISVKTQATNLESSKTFRKANLSTLVIMPTYNEAENILTIAGGLLSTVTDVDLLIVDDNSPDGTGAVADKLAAENPRVHVLHRTEKNGLGPAYLAGFAWGFERGYEYLVEMDADGSHRAEDLLKLLEVAPQNDLVIGSRWVQGGRVLNWPLSRQIISRVGNLYARFMLRAGINDITAGFRVFRASFLRSLDLSNVASAGYSFQVEMAWRCFKANARITEVPITFVERAIGSSKMSRKIVFEALWRVTRWGFERR
jgi:apolipoprotein N-acyltransferase